MMDNPGEKDQIQLPRAVALFGATDTQQGFEGSDPKREGIDSVVFNGQSFLVRGIDRYWDATGMTQAYGKRVNNFLRTDSTQRYLAALSRKLGIPVESEQGNSLVYRTQRGGGTVDSGTWVHQQVALKLAAWLNEDFEVWVWDVIEKLFNTGSVQLRDELVGLGQALHLKDQKLAELSNEYARLEHRCDRLHYENDELSELAQWRRANSWGGSDS